MFSRRVGVEVCEPAVQALTRLEPVYDCAKFASNQNPESVDKMDANYREQQQESTHDEQS